MPPKPALILKRKETTEVRCVHLITLHKEGLSCAKISEKTGVPKTTCFDIVKRDEERHRETPDSSSDSPLMHLVRALYISISNCSLWLKLTCLLDKFDPQRANLVLLTNELGRSTIQEADDCCDKHSLEGMSPNQAISILCRI